MDSLVLSCLLVGYYSMNFRMALRLQLSMLIVIVQYPIFEKSTHLTPLLDHRYVY